MTKDQPAPPRDDRPGKDADDVPFSDDDPLGDYFQDEDDAKQAILDCFNQVSKLVGMESARRRFSDFTDSLPVPRGRPPGMVWTRYHRDLFLGYSTAPVGRKTKKAREIGERYGRSSGAAIQDLKRLRKDWKARGPIGQEWLILDWFQPEAATQAGSAIFGDHLGTEKPSDF